MPRKMTDEIGARGDKVAAYGWRLLDQPGTLMEIHKNELLVDQNYQRSTVRGHNKILRITSEWSWLACGTLICADRGGDIYVVDGQHRLMAARKRSDIQTLPCIVFPSCGQKDEAVGFLRANVNRQPLKGYETFKARLTSGDPIATAIDQMVRTSGRKIADHAAASTVSCIQSLAKMAERDMGRTTRIFPLVERICAERAFSKEIMEALFYIDERLNDEQVTDAKMARRWVQIGADALIDSIRKAKAFEGKAGSRVLARGAVQAHNKGLRSNRIEIFGGEG